MSHKLPIGTFITAKRIFQRGRGTALTHGNIYRVVGYNERTIYKSDYIVEFIDSIREEKMGKNIISLFDGGFPFPTWGVNHEFIEVIIDQNDIEYFI